MKKETLPTFTSFLIGFGLLILLITLNKIAQLLN